MFYWGRCKGCDVISREQCVPHHNIKGSKIVDDSLTRFLAGAVIGGIICLLSLSFGVE